jgi:ketosteroid isomerase-like protein
MANELSTREIVDRYNAAIIHKSADALAAIYAEDATHAFPFGHSEAATLRGREAIRTFYTGAWATAPAIVRGIGNVVLHEGADGRTVTVEEDIELTNTTTGTDFVASTVLVMEIEAGQIAQVRDYTDNLTIARGLGQIPVVA